MFGVGNLVFYTNLALFVLVNVVQILDFTILSIFLDLDNLSWASYTNLWKPLEFFSYNGYAVGVLLVNHFFWEYMELYMLKYRNNKVDDSVSKFISATRNKLPKHLLFGYLLILGCGLYLYAPFRMVYGNLPLILHISGTFGVIFAETQSARPNGDRLQTFFHCAAMFLVMAVGMFVTARGSSLFWIVKFASVFPYFFAAFANLPKGEKMLKMRAEIKMFKHLCDSVVIVLFLRDRATEVNAFLHRRGMPLEQIPCDPPTVMTIVYSFNDNLWRVIERFGGG